MEAEFMKAEERKSYCQQLFEKYNIYEILRGN